MNKNKRDRIGIMIFAYGIFVLLLLWALTGCATAPTVESLQASAETCQGKVQFKVSHSNADTKVAYNCVWEQTEEPFYDVEIKDASE